MGEGSVTSGISDHGQQALGDVVFVEVAEVGKVLAAGGAAGVVESGSMELLRSTHVPGAQRDPVEGGSDGVSLRQQLLGPAAPADCAPVRVRPGTRNCPAQRCGEVSA
ncbi:hypothetical protein ABZY57_20635 [Streptomyces sp. NPDC006450]|uniref:hypothetical protein n=1 Tax=Streptomyces sp. NPDC006450 TaxID=3155458 RepID=UPI0033B3ADA0